MRRLFRPRAATSQRRPADATARPAAQNADAGAASVDAEAAMTGDAAAAVAPPRRLPYILAVGLISVLVISLALLALWQEKKAYRERASVATQNIAGLLDRQIGGVFAKVDVALQAVVLDYRQQSISQRQPPGGLNAYLAERQALLPEVLALRILDREGIVRFGNKLPSGTSVDLSGRSFFIRARDDASGDLIITGPGMAPIDQRWVIAIARRLSAADGSFAGVVYALLPTAYFQGVFSSLALGPQGAATIRTADLALVHRYPDNRGSVGSRDVSPELRDRVEARPAGGEYIAATALDGVERSNAYRRVAGYPFYVLVGLATDDYMGGWRNSVLVFSGLTALTILVTALGSLLVYRAACRQHAEIARREQIAAALHASDEKFRAAFANAPVGFAMSTPAGGFVDANPAYCRISGYALAELKTMNFRQMLHPDDIDEHEASIERLLAEPNAEFVVERRQLRKDGSQVSVRMCVSTVRDTRAGARWIIAIVEDISDRKRAERALEEHREQLEATVAERTREVRRLAAEATDAEERERQAIARDLHDDLGQLLHVVQIRLDLLAQQTTSADDRAFVDQTSALIVEASRQVRSLTSQLSPPILTTLGLPAALSWLCDEIRQTYEIGVSCSGEVAPAVLSRAQSAILFRAARELLINVAKHSGGATARLQLDHDDDVLTLVVEDSGNGVPVREESLVTRKGFGLANVRERITFFGGTMRTQTPATGGVRIVLQMPVGADAGDAAEASRRCRAPAPIDPR